jgi:hypothetical protein
MTVGMVQWDDTACAATIQQEEGSEEVRGEEAGDSDGDDAVKSSSGADVNQREEARG